MWNAVWTWAGENYPILLLFVVAVALVWMIAKFYYTRFVKFEKQIKDLPCHTHEQTHQKILDSLNTVITYLKMKDSKAAVLFSQKESPRKLNPSGRHIFEDCNGMLFLEENKKILLSAIAAKAPKTALDVENVANEVLIERLDSDIFNDIKAWVYERPPVKVEIQGMDKEYAIAMNDVCFILSLPLRDMYLDLHSELKTE